MRTVAGRASHAPTRAENWTLKQLRVTADESLSLIENQARNRSLRTAQAATARLASSHCDQISLNPFTSRSMSPSVWTGEGVRRSRSVPTGTVG